VYGRDPGLALEDIAERIAVGGWPGSLRSSVRFGLRAMRAYVEEVRCVDVGRIDGVRRDPDKVGRLLRSLARNVASEVSLATLAKDTLSQDGDGADQRLDEHTVSDYLTVLRRTMVVEDQPPWVPHLRSRSAPRRTVKRHFVDSSIAVAVLGTTPERLLRNPELLGMLFESLVVHDLRVYAQAIEGTVLHYRDNTGLEVDAIVELPSGEWAAFEVKLGLKMIDNAAMALLKFANRVDTSRCGEPALLAVIVPPGPSYRRKDGVNVISIGTLGP
ncbi:MAG: ATP-binding protein, partial [Candidatus Dormibacteraceae bacterium]